MLLGQLLFLVFLEEVLLFFSASRFSSWWFLTWIKVGLHYWWKADKFWLLDRCVAHCVRYCWTWSAWAHYLVEDFVSNLLSSFCKILFVLDALALSYEVLNICSWHWRLRNMRIRRLIFLHIQKLSIFSLLLEFVFVFLHHRVFKVAWLVTSLDKIASIVWLGTSSWACSLVLLSLWLFMTQRCWP